MEDNKYSQDNNNYKNEYSDISELNDFDEHINNNNNLAENTSVNEEEIIDNIEPIAKDKVNTIKDEDEAINNSQKKRKGERSTSKGIYLNSKNVFGWIISRFRNTIIIIIGGLVAILCLTISMDRIVDSRNLENYSIEQKIERIEKMNIFQSNELLKYMQEEEVQKRINSKQLNLKRLDKAPYVIEVKND